VWVMKGRRRPTLGRRPKEADFNQREKDFSHPRLLRVCQGFGSHSWAGFTGVSCSLPFVPLVGGKGGLGAYPPGPLPGASIPAPHTGSFSQRGKGKVPPPSPNLTKVGVGRPPAEGQRRPVLIGVKSFSHPHLPRVCEGFRGPLVGGLL